MWLYNADAKVSTDCTVRWCHESSKVVEMTNGSIEKEINEKEKLLEIEVLHKIYSSPNQVGGDVYSASSVKEDNGESVGNSEKRIFVETILPSHLGVNKEVHSKGTKVNEAKNEGDVGIVDQTGESFTYKHKYPTKYVISLETKVKIMVIGEGMEDHDDESQVKKGGEGTVLDDTTLDTTCDDSTDVGTLNSTEEASYGDENDPEKKSENVFSFDINLVSSKGDDESRSKTHKTNNGTNGPTTYSDTKYFRETSEQESQHVSGYASEEHVEEISEHIVSKTDDQIDSEEARVAFESEQEVSTEISSKQVESHDTEEYLASSTTTVVSEYSLNRKEQSLNQREMKHKSSQGTKDKFGALSFELAPLVKHAKERTFRLDNVFERCGTFQTRVILHQFVLQILTWSYASQMFTAGVGETMSGWPRNMMLLQGNMGPDEAEKVIVAFWKSPLLEYLRLRYDIGDKGLRHLAKHYLEMFIILGNLRRSLWFRSGHPSVYRIASWIIFNTWKVSPCRAPSLPMVFLFPPIKKPFQCECQRTSGRAHSGPCRAIQVSRTKRARLPLKPYCEPTTFPSAEEPKTPNLAEPKRKQVPALLLPQDQTTKENEKPDPATHKPPTCGMPFVVRLHKDHKGCDRCLDSLSDSERATFESKGHSPRVMLTRGGCGRDCCVFPRQNDDRPSRLCRKCFFDTHKTDPSAGGECFRGKRRLILNSNMLILKSS